MGFLFYNNWPYSATYFPSMDDHIDPINHDYFAGLMTELNRIEYYLGMNPQGAYKDLTERLSGFNYSIDNNYLDINNRIDQEILDINTILGPDVARGYSNVRDKLELHDHSGGYSGAPILSSVLNVWANTSFYATPYVLSPGGGLGSCYAGFNYYDNSYLGPSIVGAGNNKIFIFNTPTQVFTTHTLSQYTSDGLGAVRIGDVLYAACSGAPGKVLKLVISNWAETLIPLNSGENAPRQMTYVGGYIYFPCWVSPGKLIKFDPGDDSWSAYAFDAGQNEPVAICDDGTYVYTCTNTTPVQLLKFNPAGPSHQTFIIEDLKPEIVKMIIQGNYLYIFSNDADTQVCRINLTNNNSQILQNVWSGVVRSATWWDPYIVVMIDAGGYSRFVLWDLTTDVSYISNTIGTYEYGHWIQVTNDYLLWTENTSNTRVLAMHLSSI